MSKGRLALVIGVAVTLLTVLASVVVGLATNTASELPQLPGPLDLIRTHPLRTLAVSAPCLGVLTAIAFFTASSGPRSASQEDVESLHGRFDELAVRSHAGNLMKRLPPYARELLVHADRGNRERVWQVIAPFTDDAIDPRVLAKEWAKEPPTVLEELPTVARLVVAELFISYGQPEAAIPQIRAAVQRGVTPRAYWLFRIAKLHGETTSEKSPEFREAFAEVERIDASYPLARAIRADENRQWEQIAREMQEWQPSSMWERNVATMYRALALHLLEKLDEAIAFLESRLDDSPSPACMLLLSRLLRARAVEGTGDSRLLDAQHAVEVAVQARNLQRSWRGASGEATATAAEAAMTADDPQLVWTLTRPTPEGQATDAEAADILVLPLAAMGAALTGRVAQARELVPALDGYVRRRVEAEIASATSDESAAEAWRSALTAATTTEEKLHALRGLAFEGVTDSSALDELRPLYPQAVADAELIAEIYAASGAEREERLRSLEVVNPLASVERADLLRRSDPKAAAQLLLDAAERWQHPRLHLLAMDCYQEAGMLPEAEQVAHAFLSLYGASWPGRTIVMQRLYNIQSLRLDWAGAVKTARALLNIDPNDQDVRWHLASALHRGGDPEEAWRTLNRRGTRLTPTTPAHAYLLLDLTRRYASANEVARTALATLHAFRDDQDVHAAAIHAVTMRIDRDDLPEDLGVQVTEAWQAFLDRYPNSGHFKAHAIDPANPLSELQPDLKRQAETYQEALRLIRKEGFPLGILDQVVAKPYAAIFLHRPLGYHRMVYPSFGDQAVERDIARTALSGSVLVDASALYTLSVLPDVTQTLLALISRPVITDMGLQDLLMTDDLFSIPSAGTLGYDIRTERVVAHEADPETATKQLKQARTMLTTARALRRISHPELVHLPPPEDGRRVVWALTLDAAKHHDISLWADDTGLRTVAHSLGVKTFSTHALLTIAQERQRIDTTTAHEATRELIREYTVDLPYSHDLLKAVAAEQNWEPRSVATVLSRGATWVHLQQALALFFEAFKSAPNKDAATTWAYAAISGMQELVGVENAADGLKALVTMALVSLTDQQDRLPAMMTALEAAAPDRAETVIRAALEHLWSEIARRLPVEQAVTTFLGIVRHLDDQYRLYCAQLILDL